MGKDTQKKDKSIKEFNLTDIELSEFSFYDTSIKGKEIEMRGYYSEKLQAEGRLYQRLGINPNEYEIDKSRIYSTGKIFAKKLPKPEVKPEPDEPTKEK